MESPHPNTIASEDTFISSPKEQELEAPDKDLQEQFDAQIRDENVPSQAAAGPFLSSERTEGDDDTEVVEEEGTVDAEIAGNDTITESKRGAAAAGRGKGRGGRVASTSSAKGRGGSAGKGAAKTKRGGASSASTRGAKQGRVPSAAGSKTGKGGVKASAGSSKAKGPLNNASTTGDGEGSSSSNIVIGAESVGGIGSGPSNTVFPLARVSRIVKVDKEIEMTSKDAIWTIAVATELFIKHLTDSAYAKARLDKKKTITFKELSSAVESQNEFFFLQDVIPQPISFAKAMEMRQEVEEKNRMREAGLFDDEEEELDTAPLVNQTIGDGTEETKLKATENVDEQGDVAMEGDEPPALLPNGASKTDKLSNGHVEAADEEMLT